MSRLEKARCQPQHGSALVREAVATLMEEVPGWQFLNEPIAIERKYSFNNFHETMAFVNAVAWIAHREDHHPDLFVGYSKCTIRYSTHSVGGLSENDFICAAKINALLIP